MKKSLQTENILKVSNTGLPLVPYAKLNHSFLAPLTRCATEPEREIFRRTGLCLLDVAPSRHILINI